MQKTSYPTSNKYSQTGEEIILAEIFEKIGSNKFLVDIGAGDGYKLSNTRRLIEDGWQGILIDKDGVGDVYAEFVTPMNILAILKKYGCPQIFDLLSIDIDGFDFQVLIEILSEYSPRVIICEFNPSLTGSKYLKYEEGYTWDGTTKYGFSFEAGKKLMDKAGYKLVHNQKDLNLIFLQKDINFPTKEVTYKIQYPHPHNANANFVEY